MNITAFGEILWDVFDDKKEIGGAPFNFSAHMAALGAQVSLVSAVGSDALGDEALDMVRKFGVSDRFISRVPYSTGVCRVSLTNGAPSYNIVENAAYDHIPHCAAENTDALYFGTLAQRAPDSAAALRELIESSNAREVFCDINIRQNYYSEAILNESLSRATILKISREEMGVFGIRDQSALLKKLSRDYPLRLIILTLDKDGALAYDCAGGIVTYSCVPVNKVRSTVGAGDSFSACFLYNYLSGAGIKASLDRAVALSDYVVTQLGAIPECPAELLREVRGA